MFLFIYFFLKNVNDKEYFGIKIFLIIKNILMKGPALIPD